MTSMQMTNLQRRVKKLENQMNPPQGPTKIWQIVYVGLDGCRVDGPKIQWQAASWWGISRTWVCR
jgi:hypothetical protein